MLVKDDDQLIRRLRNDFEASKTEGIVRWKSLRNVLLRNS